MKSKQKTDELQISLPVKWCIWIQSAWTEGRWVFLMDTTYETAEMNQTMCIAEDGKNNFPGHITLSYERLNSTVLTSTVRTMHVHFVTNSATSLTLAECTVDIIFITFTILITPPLRKQRAFPSGGHFSSLKGRSLFFEIFRKLSIHPNGVTHWGLFITKV